MLTTLLLCLPVVAGSPKVTWDAPSFYAEGAPYDVTLTIEAPEDGAELKTWALSPAIFTLDGKPLAKREGKDVLPLAPGAKLSYSFDLSGAIQASKGFSGKDFKLSVDEAFSAASAVEVSVGKAAPKDLDFMTLPEDQLGKYNVLLSTNRGNMLVEFWPEVAPNHVRNFLDLCQHGFYDGLSFHRVIPGFMIQGGDPSGDGTGGNDRKVNAEFSKDPKYKHVKGVLSMARLGHDVNSATSQFFLMHATYPSLDGQYSAFGKLKWGESVIDLIVSTPRDARDKPREKQYIKFAKVLLAE